MIQAFLQLGQKAEPGEEALGPCQHALETLLSSVGLLLTVLELRAVPDWEVLPPRAGPWYALYKPGMQAVRML